MEIACSTIEPPYLVVRSFVFICFLLIFFGQLGQWAIRQRISLWFFCPHTKDNYGKREERKYKKFSCYLSAILNFKFFQYFLQQMSEGARVAKLFRALLHGMGGPRFEPRCRLQIFSVNFSFFPSFNSWRADQHGSGR